MWQRLIWLVAVLHHHMQAAAYSRALTQARRSPPSQRPPPPVAKAAIQAPSCRALPYNHTIRFTLVRRDDWEQDRLLETMGEALRIRNFVTNIPTCGQTSYDAAVRHVRSYWVADFITCIHGIYDSIPCPRAYILLPPTLVTPTLIAMSSPEGQVPRCCL
jgi:hypothetical protein